jgi:hypothetical protein
MAGVAGGFFCVIQCAAVQAVMHCGDTGEFSHLIQIANFSMAGFAADTVFGNSEILAMLNVARNSI